jgi:ribonuclease-3
VNESSDSGAPQFLRPIELESALGYVFSDRDLLQRALTHGSVGERGGRNNERLEFLGDAVLALATSRELYRRSEDLSEGEMTRIRAALVSRKSMAEEAKRLELSRYLRVGKMFADATKITDTVVSNAREAILGAIFLESGFDAAANVVQRLLEPRLLAALAVPERRDWKSLLGHVAQTDRLGAVVYLLLSQAGPDHDRTFEIAVELSGRRHPSGIGRSKKDAEQAAAREALSVLGALDRWP